MKRVSKSLFNRITLIRPVVYRGDPEVEQDPTIGHETGKEAPWTWVHKEYNKRNPNDQISLYQTQYYGHTGEAKFKEGMGDWKSVVEEAERMTRDE